MKRSWIRSLTSPRSRRPVVRPSLHRLEARDVPAVVTFQEGVAGYSGTQDTDIFSVTPNTPQGSKAFFNADAQDTDTGVAGNRIALLRFDNIFGAGPGQIPLGSKINSAKLTVNVTNDADNNSIISLSRMLIDWNEATTTFNSLNKGVRNDGTDAEAFFDGAVPPVGAGVKDVDTLGNTLQFWANGGANFGWVIINDTSDGMDFDSSEALVDSSRPLLTVDYDAPAGAGAFRFADSSYFVNEGKLQASISVQRVGGATGTVTVDYATANGTAVSGSDFTAAAGKLTFAPNELVKTFTVTVANDTAIEGPEAFSITLGNPTGGATVEGAGTTTINLRDDDLLLSEIVADPPGVDTNYEYIELVGTPGADLTGYYVVQFEGDTGAALPGSADFVQNLAGFKLGSNGMLVITGSNYAFTLPAATTQIKRAEFDTTTGLENPTATYMIIKSATPIVAATDYDLDDSLATRDVEALPVGSLIVDSVGWTDGGASDLIYTASAVIGVAGRADAVTRFFTDATPNSAAAWYVGDLAGAVPSGKLYDPARASGNIPAGASITPGEPNIVPASFRFTASSYAVAEDVPGGTVTLTVERIGNTSEAGSVTYTIAPGTASAGDFSAMPLSATLNFGPDVTTQTITITIVNDTLPEADETVLVTLSNANAGANIASPSSAAVVIFDNDATRASFFDGDANGYFGTVDTQIDAANPFTGAGSLESIASDLDNLGFTQQSLLRFENIFGTGPGQVPIGSTIHAASITLSVLNGSNGLITFHRMLTPWDETFTNWDAFGGNGIAPDDIEALLSPDATFTSASLTSTQSVADFAGVMQRWASGVGDNYGWVVLNDGADELVFGASDSIAAANRPVLNIAYTAPTGAGAFKFSDPVVATTENGMTATVTVLRVGGGNGTVGVNYATANGTALAGSDFTSASGTLTFAPDEFFKTITINISKDAALEGLESFAVNLTSPTGGATISGASATIEIRDGQVDTGLLVNEVLVNPPGNDAPYEYLELKGATSGRMGSVYLLAIEGDGTAAGQSDIVFDLQSLKSGTNGLTMFRAADGHPAGPGTTSVITDLFGSSSTRSLENGTQSIVLIYSPSAPLRQGYDYDWNNDGVLDLPADAVILDAVGWQDVTGFVYGGVSLTQAGGGTPDAATRFRNDSTANSLAAWFTGDLLGANSTGLDYDPAAASANLPANAKLTPGAANYDPASLPAAKVASLTINGGAAQRSRVTTVEILFDQIVILPGDLNAAFQFKRVSDNSIVTIDNALSIIDNSGAGTKVTFKWGGTTAVDGAVGNRSLADGRYVLTATATAITNANGSLDGDSDGNAGGNFVSVSTPFGGPGVPPTGIFRLFGDADGSGQVDSSDFLAFRLSFLSASPTFDFDGSGQVDSADFLSFRLHFLQSVV